MTMRNQGLVKTFDAGASVNHARFVKFDSDDSTVIQSAAAGDSTIGVSDFSATATATASGERVDVQLTDVATVTYGGTVTRGQLLMSDSTGRAITAAAAAGTNVRYCGVAMVSGVVGDLGAVLLTPGSFQG
jgi:hypothetical protein